MPCDSAAAALASAQELEDCLALRLPVGPGCAALKLLCVSDTHDQHMFMPKALPKADVLVHAGDFSCMGSREELESFRAWIDTLLADGTVGDVVFVAGNHELSLEGTAKREAVRRNQAEMKERLVAGSRVHYLEDDACELHGLTFFGSPWVNRFGRDWAFQAADNEADLGSRYAAVLEGVDVLVTHQPPLGQGDRNTCDARAGSSQLLERVKVVQPLLHVFGHIHTGHGVSCHEEARTLFVNAAICDEDYKAIQKPVLVELVPARP